MAVAHEIYMQGNFSMSQRMILQLGYTHSVVLVFPTRHTSPCLVWTCIYSLVYLVTVEQWSQTLKGRRHNDAQWSFHARGCFIHSQNIDTVMFTTHGAQLVVGSRHTDIAFLNGTTEFLPTEITTAVQESNESCGEQKSLDLELTKTIIIGLMLSTITGITVMGNTLVVIAVCVVKKLRQPSNYLLVSLAIADLSVAVAVMPFVIVTDLTGGVWLFGEVFCNIFIGMDVMCCTASIMTLCVISVDR